MGNSRNSNTNSPKQTALVVPPAASNATATLQTGNIFIRTAHKILHTINQQCNMKFIFTKNDAYV